MKLIELENIIDIEIEKSLVRFGNMESFYIKFLKKFIDDKSLQSLTEGIERGDLKKVGESAHTLKGVAGNLGLKKIYELSMELMKVESLTKDEINSLYEELKIEMEKTVEALSKLD